MMLDCTWSMYMQLIPKPGGAGLPTTCQRFPLLRLECLMWSWWLPWQKKKSRKALTCNMVEGASFSSLLCHLNGSLCPGTLGFVLFIYFINNIGVKISLTCAFYPVPLSRATLYSFIMHSFILKVEYPQCAQAPSQVLGIKQKSCGASLWGGGAQSRAWAGKPVRSFRGMCSGQVLNL